MDNFDMFGFPPPSDSAHHPPDNPIEGIDILKKEGNRVIASDPAKACNLYSNCIEMDNVFCVLPDRDRAIIHSNRSQALMKLGDLENAFNDAINCVQIDPSFVKGYWRAATVMKHMNKSKEALEALFDGLAQVRGTGLNQLRDRVDFVLEITSLTSNLEGKWKKAEFLFRTIKVETRVWTEVVKRLAIKPEYKGLHLVLLGGTERYNKGEGGMATSCSTKGIGIRTMVRDLSLMQLKEWGAKLLHQLIVHGADFNELSLKEGDTPLHCALLLALSNGWFVLLEYLMREKYPKPQSRNLWDKSGASLYHMVAKSSTSHQLYALDSLRRHQVSPLLLDKESRTAISYAANQDVKMKIKDAVEAWQKMRYNEASQRPTRNQHTQSQQVPPSQPIWQDSGRPDHRQQESFQWEQQQQTAEACGYNSTYSGQSYWESQQQRYEASNHPVLSDMERQRQKQAQNRQQLEEQRRRQKDEDRQRREAEEEKKRREQLNKQKKEEEERRWIGKEKKQKEDERKRKEAEKQEKRRQRLTSKQEPDLSRQSLYQQGLHYADHNQPVLAVTCFAKFISNNYNNQYTLNDVERCRKAFAKQLQFLEELPEDIQCMDSSHSWLTTVETLASEQQWKAISMLIKKGGFAHGCSCSNISIAKFLKTWNKSLKLNKIKFVQLLLEFEARPNGLLNEEELPLVLCVKNHNYDGDMIMLLLEHKAYPSQLSINQGDTPLHAALKIGFGLNDRRFKILNFLLEKYSDPTGVQYLNPSRQDAAENGLYHVAIKEGTKNLSLEAVKLLCKYKVNPRLANKNGEIPLEMVKRNDRRYPFLTQAAASHPKPANKPSAKGDNVSMVSQQSAMPSQGEDGLARPVNSSGDDGIRVSGDSASLKPSGGTVLRTSRKDQMKRDVACMIDVLPPFVVKHPRVEEPEVFQPRIEVDDAENKQANCQDQMASVEAQGSQDEVHAVQCDDTDNADEEDETEEEADVEDPFIFDNLTWEVECTAKAWKILKDRHVQHRLKQGIIRKIKLLGNGDWRPKLCKQLDGLPRERDMNLFEAKLTRGGRILWELAIAFSPRCSEESEKRLGADGAFCDGSTSFAVAGGRIYSEIIRIWDIVFDHDNLARSIEVIVKSYERGKDCIIQKKLVGITRQEFTPGKTTGQRVPMYFRETSEDSPQKSPRKGSQQVVDNKVKGFFPPASSKENEYHIMKFYSFNSSLVNAILTDSNIKVDFPFRVTELEHAIINLQPKPPSSVLLLGRSGTGKTTCCLYRLWTAFVRYWKMAAAAGEPLIERDVAFIHGDGLNEEEEQKDEARFLLGVNYADEEEFETCSETSIDNDAPSSGANHLSDEEENPESIMDHLHQIFITKNAVLCSEVQRNFRDLSHGCEFAQEHCNVEENPIPLRLQAAHSASFPLFLNSRQFLLMLDGSLPDPYFPRNEDGSLKRKIHAWGKDEGPMEYIPVLEDEDEESDGEESDDNVVDGADNEGDTEEDLAIGDQAPIEKVNIKYDPRREVTYEVFAYELWKKINKKTKLLYHPTLVWMEITSFIKGSIEALHTNKGHLAEEGYKELGRKRAPNFTADRSKIYKVYEAYEHEKHQRNLFDEADLVYHIYRRMRDIQKPDWAVHQFYVDETQDFTQAELSLLIRCCHDPNALFLTGDTAQSIMRGVAFRFDDLKCLFHYASKSVKALGKHTAVRVPKRVYQLTHNYRSHAGILNLASSVVDLMFHFFPNSFDRLDRDQGLLEGPSPVLLESCSFSDLALLLRGNKRKTSEIEFGAHQCILVANEEAKEKLPAELSFGLVLTIFEAKGLEFDDVLLYNVFKDSPADKEWRVVTDFLDELIEEYEQRRLRKDQGNSTNLHTIDLQNLEAANRPRPLKFDPDKHKVLNSELKYLYTAITRARVNVWIFDEDNVKRAPMFEYFRRLTLVKVVRPDEVDKGGNSELDSMFVETSTKEEWDQKGDYFYEHKLWLVAAKCYARAGDEKKKTKALAHHRALEAERLRDQPSKMREEFLAAAQAFLQCDLGSLSARCLFNAKEYLLSAQLFEKLGEMLKAAKIFENRAKRYDDASRCYEQYGDYAKAIELLVMLGVHIKAADVVERYEQFKAEYANIKLPTRVKPPRASDTVENLCHQAANYHHRHGNNEKMMRALNQLPKFEDRINFLKKKGLNLLAVDILKEDGKYLEAAKILRSQGNLKDACDLLDVSDHPQFIAECHLGRARKLISSVNDDSTRKMVVEDILTTSLKLFQETKDNSRQAEARLLLGILKSDVAIVKTSRAEFLKAANPIGEVYAADVLLSKLALPEYKKMRAVFYPLNKLFLLINALSKANNADDKRHAALCDAFYGIEKAREGNKVSFNMHEGARIQKLLTQVVPKEADLDTMHLKIIINDLIPIATGWVNLLRKVGQEASEKLKQCPDYVVGLKCTKPDSCQHKHEPYSKGILLDYVYNVVSLILLDHFINQAKALPNMATFTPLMREVFDEKQQEMNCDHLYSLFYPKHVHPSQISENGQTIRHFQSTIHYPEVISQMKWYVKSKHEDAGKFLRKGDQDKNRRANTDVWLLVWNVHHLFRQNTRVLEDWVAVQEKYCNDTWKAHTNPLGMMRISGPYKHTGIPRLDKGKPRIMYMSYMRLFVESFAKLYSPKIDVLDAVSSFNRFLGALATHPVEPLIPSIRNIVSLLELWLTICLTIIAKVEERTVVIPASYLAQLNYYDTLCYSSKSTVPALFNVISQVRAGPLLMKRMVYNKLEYMADLVCACDKFRNFNILLDAFRNEACIQSGEAERALVFTLVMLCNVGTAFSHEYGTYIRELINTIPMAKYPPRLSNNLDAIKSAKSFKDSLVTLQSLLQEREHEFCFSCKWRNVGGLHHTKLDPSQFLDVCYRPLENISSRRTEEDDCSDVDRKNDPDEMDISPEVAERVLQSHEELEEQQLKVIAIKKIQGWARHILKKLKLLRAASVFYEYAYLHGIAFTICFKQTSNDQANSVLGTPSQWVERRIEQFTISESVCTICDVTFQGKLQTAAYQFETPDDAEMEDAERKPGSPVDRPPSPPLAALIESAPTRQEHEQSALHQERMRRFSAYKLYLMNTTYPVIHDATHYQRQFFSGPLINDEVNKQRIALFGERLTSCGLKLYNAIEDIQKRNAWEQLTLLNGPIEELQTAVNNAKQVATELETNTQGLREEDGARSQATPSKQSLAMHPGSEETGAFEDEDNDDHLLKITQEPDKGLQTSVRQKRKQKSKYMGSRIKRR